MLVEEKDLYIYKNDKIKFAITKRGIDAKDSEELKSAISDYGFEYKNLISVNQIHSDNILSLHKDYEYIKDFEEGHDAIITNRKKQPIMVYTADCLPIIIYDEVAEVVALAHAGWKGTYLKIADKVIDKMQKDYGCQIDSIQIFMGPCISVDEYEVSKELIDKFANLNVEDYYKKVGESYKLNINKINTEILLKKGIREENIRFSNFCTVKDNNKFFSYRKDKATPRRIASIIELR